MKILLLVPKIQVGSFSGLPLGLCYLSAVLKQNGFNDILSLDLNAEKESEFEKLVRWADVLGLHVHTKTFSESIRLAKRARELNPDIKIVVGGPHVTLCPEDFLLPKSIDFLVIGEGEHTFLELIRALSNGTFHFSEIKGIWYREADEFKRNLPREFVKNLDVFPFPDRRLFEMKKYSRTPRENVPIIASRSCPYQCTNCMPALREIMGPYRLRSVENVIAEMKELIEKYKVKSFDFLDNDLTVNREWLIRFCNRIIKEKFKIAWTVSVRINTLDRELMVLMKMAGCAGFEVGVESGSQEVIDKVLRKGISLEKAREVFKIADEIGLYQHVYFMIGIPGETKEQMLETINFAKSLNVDSILFSIGNPLPRTGFENICQGQGWLLGKTWDDYDNPQGRSMIKTDEWDPEFIEEAKMKILEEFEKGYWKVKKTKYYINIRVYNIVKNICRRSLCSLLRQAPYFFKNFKPRYLFIILKATKMRYFS